MPINSLINAVTRVATALSKAPPKLFDPRNQAPPSVALSRISDLWRTMGLGGMYNKMRMESSTRKGYLVGTDENGNQYFEDKTACYGTRVPPDLASGIAPPVLLTSPLLLLSCARSHPLGRVPHPLGRLGHRGLLRWQHGAPHSHPTHRPPRAAACASCCRPAPARPPRPPAAVPAHPHPARRPPPQISPDWHGWIHYMHDKPGSQMAREFGKSFKQPHLINQSMLRPEFGFEKGFHQPPGQQSARVARGRIGPKYESWSGSSKTPKELRNYADNSKTLLTHP